MALGIAQQRGDVLGSCLRIGRWLDEQAGDVVHDRVDRATGGTRDLWDAGCGRLDEHDAETLLFEPGPPRATQHGEHIATAVQRRELFIGHPAQKPNRCLSLVGHAFEPAAIAAVPGHGKNEVGELAGEHGARADHRIDALARHQPADAHDEGRVHGKVERPAGRGTRRGVQRVKAFGIDPRWHVDRGQ